MDYITLIECIKEYQIKKTSESSLSIYNYFNKIVCKCVCKISQKFKYYIPIGEGITKLYVIVDRLDVDKFNNDMKIRGYIYKTLYWGLFEFAKREVTECYNTLNVENLETYKDERFDKGEIKYSKTKISIIELKDDKHYLTMCELIVRLKRGDTKHGVMNELGLSESFYWYLLRKIKSVYLKRGK